MDGTIPIQVHYDGQINDKMAGFYRSQYTHSGKTAYIAVTQFEESDARRAFPCMDHPSKKATFDISMDIDSDRVAISNSAIKEETILADGKKRVIFEQTPKMSTYLVFFGVGEFEFTRDTVDPRVRVATLPGMKPYGQFGLEFGRKSLAFSEDYYGIPYPLPKMDLIAIPDFAFGAMAASPEEIWKVIFEPAFMSRVIPGCKDIDQPAEGEYGIKMVLGIPAVQGHYSGTLRILEKNPFDIIKGSIVGQGGLGKIDGTWEMQFKKSNDQESRVTYAVNVDISGPMASMVGGFMEQVADSLVKQGFDSFNQAIKGATENAASQTPLKSTAPPRPNLIKMLFRSVWDVVSSKLRSLFKPKSVG